MLTALSAKNKLEFVDRTATQPAKTDSTFSTWNRCNNMVASWQVLKMDEAHLYLALVCLM